MTDGPHKSLAMLPRWKKVAEYADKPAFEQSDVDAALQRALAADYSHIPQAVRDGIRGVMDDPNDTIFRDLKIQKLEALRGVAAGPTLTSTLIDSCIQHLQEEAPGPHAFQSALADAFTATAASQVRSIEEHYHRKVGKARAHDVRNRLENAVGTSPYRALAQNVGSGKGKRPTVSTQRSGLDDGVKL